MPFNIVSFLCAFLGLKVEITQMSGLVISGKFAHFSWEPGSIAFIVENEHSTYVVNWEHIMRLTFPTKEVPEIELRNSNR